MRTEWRPGDRLPPLRALRAELGVSQNTLRAALALLAHEGLVASRHGSGVYVLATPSAPWVGILTEYDITLPGAAALSAPVFWHLRRILRERGRATTLYVGEVPPGGPGEGRYCEAFRRDLLAHRLAGLVVLSAPDPALVPVLRAEGIPVASTVSELGAQVGQDHAGFVRNAVYALHAQGCRRIGLLAWHREAAIPAFRAVLEELGCELRPRWIRGDFEPAATASGWSQFRELWSAHPEHPDGLVVADDALYLGVQHAVLDMGLCVPERLQIATAMNRGSDIGVTLPILRFECDPAELAAALVDELEAQFAGRPHSHTRVVLPYRRCPHSPEEARVPADAPSAPCAQGRG